MTDVIGQNIGDVKKRFLQLHPVNATSGGVFSFKNGLPLIKFDIASSQMPLYMDGSSLRLSGNFTARQGAAGTTALTNTDLNFLDGFCGINQCIESVTIYSKRLNETLERINTYYRLCPSIVSGTNACKDIETRHSNYGGQHCTTPLTRPGLIGVIFGAQATANQASYQLANLVLTVPVYELGGAPAQQVQGQVSQFNFNSWSSMFQTLNSSDSVIAMTPGLSRVSSILMNFITASDLGNQAFNSARLGNVAETRQLRWSKNGALFPLQYRLETVAQGNNDTAKVNVNNAQSFHTYSVNADLFRNYLEGLTTDGYAKVRNCMSAYNNWSGGSTDRAQNSGRTGILPSCSDGLAMLYDRFGSGVNFQQMVWSIQLQTSATNQLEITDGVTGIAPAVAAVNIANNIDGTAATAQAVSIFYLNKNTLLLSPQGINVVR